MASTIWKGQLGFGLVSVPVRLYRAARKERVRLRYLTPSDQPDQPDEPTVPLTTKRKDVVPIQPKSEDREPTHEQSQGGTGTPQTSVARVTQTVLSQVDQRPVPRSDLLQGHEVAPNQYVTLTQQELRSLRPEISSEMQIVRSVHLEEIDPVYFETSYYVMPDRGGERAYSLLFAALKESRFVALATVAMHGREHVVVIRPGAKGLLAHTMYYEDEVRAETEFEVGISNVGPKELQLAKTFVEAIAGPFAPAEFRDSHREKLQALISAKLGLGDVSPAGADTRETAPMIDIVEALRKSIESSQKLSQSDAPEQKREPGRVTEQKAWPRKRRA